MRGGARLRLEEVQAKHPRRKSPCAALLAELEAVEDSEGRSNLLDLIGLLSCRRAVRPLLAMAAKLEPEVPIPRETVWIKSPQRDLLADIFIALGRIDTPLSQGVLARFLLTSKNPLVRADAMEAMAFGKNFDSELVSPYASMEATIPEILSALYALEFNHRKTPEEVENRLRPLLAHEYPNVRSFCINVMRFNAAHRDLVATMLNDPSQGIREDAAEALELMGP